jgi:hypothetical protein
MEFVWLAAGTGDVLTPAFWAFGLAQVPVFVSPVRTAPSAGEKEGGDQVVPAFNPESLPLNEGRCDLVSRSGQDPLKGALGDPHTLGALFLLEAN